MRQVLYPNNILMTTKDKNYIDRNSTNHHGDSDIMVTDRGRENASMERDSDRLVHDSPRK
jgi:hypothetical protein